MLSVITGTNEFFHARFGGVGLSFQVTKGPINITFGEELPREYPLFKITTESSP
jgi:hypothetical protein